MSVRNRFSLLLDPAACSLAGAVLLALPFLDSTDARAETLFKWVDQDGVTHYSDQVPPEHARFGRAELNRQGIPLRVYAPEKSKEEIAEDRELARLRAEQHRIIAEQRARDATLLRTFNTEADVLAARDSNLEAVELTMQVIRSNLDRLERRLRKKQESAANLERAGKRVPASLSREISGLLGDIRENQSLIEEREQEQAKIRRKFDKDLARFGELKGPQPSQASSQTVEESDTLELSLVDCDTSVTCGRAWGRAAQFANEYATTPIAMFTESVIMTAAPQNEKDVSIIITRLPGDDDYAAQIFLDLQCRDTPAGRETCEGRRAQEVRAKFARYVTGKRRERP